MLIDINNDDGNDRGTKSTSGEAKAKSKMTSLNKLLMNISAFSLQGKRSHMEDFFDIGYQLKPEEQRKADEWPYEYFYFGIFDGHGGCEAAKFAKENLLTYITKQAQFWSDNDDDILRAIQRGYAETHEAMRKIMHNWPRTHKYLPSTAGTTASVLFIKNGKYYTGHVGDSRIVISRRDTDSKQWISQQMTDDHKPESEYETERIIRAGGDVQPKVGVHRVVWRRPILTSEFDSTEYVVYGNQYIPKLRDDRAGDVASYPICESFVSSYQVIPFLAIARSLGDFWSINPESGQYVVSPEPDVSCTPISPNDECILLATDGLWSVMNSHTAVRALEEFKAVKEDERRSGSYAKQYFSIDNFYNVTRTPDRDNYAFSLVYLAYQVWERRSLKSDNITAVVAMLGDILSPQQNSFKRLTRSNSSAQKLPVKDNSIGKLIESNTRQISKTRLYNETIKLNQIPSFYTEPINQEDIVIMERLGNWLMLPPSAVPKVRNTHLIPPKNYHQLSIAEVRKIKHPETRQSILIRHVTDDPVDRELEPVRTSKRGTQVRNSSAQCTQSIYDFARKWPGEKDSDDEINADLDNDESEYADLLEITLSNSRHHDNDDEDEDQEDEVEVEDEDEDMDTDEDFSPSDPFDRFEDEDEDEDEPLFDPIKKAWSDDKSNKEDVEKPNTRRRSRESLNNPSREHMLQPRSDNCEESPKCERKTRSGAYLSLTGIPKRKIIHESPKSKRRKSHPLPCSARS